MVPSIVFSSWTRTLDIVACALNREDIQYCRIDGEIGTGERREVLKRFNAEKNISVLLMTLGTGAVG